MAKLRMLKKDIDYLVEELIADCYLAIFFNPKKKEQILSIMQEAVETRNTLFTNVNNPPEKHNKSLIKKHYAQVRRDMFQKVDKMFSELSAVNK